MLSIKKKNNNNFNAIVADINTKLKQNFGFNFKLSLWGSKTQKS